MQKQLILQLQVSSIILKMRLSGEKFQMRLEGEIIMKIKLILSIILTLAFGGLLSAQAQTNQQQKVRIHRQKNLSRSNLTVKFVSLVEDSRCPENARCVWSGNARIKVEIGKGRSRETFELNTDRGEKSAEFKGYKIELSALTPAPKENIRINRNGYVATFTISRIAK